MTEQRGTGPDDREVQREEASAAAASGAEVPAGPPQSPGARALVEDVRALEVDPPPPAR